MLVNIIYFQVSNFAARKVTGGVSEQRKKYVLHFAKLSFTQKI